MTDELKCSYCHNRGFFFFWENNSRRQMWKMECPHCSPIRKATKKPLPVKIKDDFIEVEL